MANPDPMGEGSTDTMYHCSNCGNDFTLQPEQEEEPCPVCGFTCSKEQCIIHNASNEDY